MEFVTYRKYKTREEADAIIDLLQSNDMEYQIEDIAPAVDITFTGGTELEDKLAIKLKPADFDRVAELLDKIADDSVELLDQDHYLLRFSESELFEILERYDEWSETDYALAKIILESKGRKISKEDIKELKTKRITELSQPEKGHKGWLIFGYISAVLGGFLGIFIGYHHFKFKKSVPTGDRVYAYDAMTRKTGLQIFYIGIIAVVFWILVWVFNIEIVKYLI